MSEKNLFDGHWNWRNRPVDERYATPQDLYAAVSKRREASWEQAFNLNGLTVDVNDAGTLGIYGGSERLYTPTNFAMRQFADLTGIKGEAYTNLLRYPAPLARDIVNQHLKDSPRKAMQALFAFDPHGGTTEGLVRGFNTTTYSRLWDYKLVKFIIEDVLTQKGWKVPPAKDNDKYPSGLYASDHDVFMFLVNDDYRVADGTDEGLGRGFFAWNNEVGGNGWGGSPRSVGFSAFLYRYVCGNHIVWGVEDVLTVRMPHVGDDIDFTFRKNIKQTLLNYLNAPTHRDELAIMAAQEFVLGNSKEAIAQTLGKVKKYAWTKAEVEAVWKFGEQNGYDVSRLWQFINAATHMSHYKTELGAFADKRATYDAKVGQLMNLVLE